MERPSLIAPAARRSPLLPWLGLALLAGSWLPGLGYYQPASGAAWVMLTVLGTLLLGGVLTRAPGRIETLVAVVLTLPMLWLAPWPYKTGPMLLVIGAAALAADPPKRWARNLAGGALAGGVVLFGQALVMLAFEAITARSHELPMPLARMIGGIAELLGMDAGVNASTPGGGGGVTVALRTMRKIYHLGATWDLLLDPVTLCFLTGGLILLSLRLWNAGESAWTRTLRSRGVLVICVLAWLPVRVGLLLALVMHRALRADFDAPVKVMDQFHSPWVLLALLTPPALLAWRAVRWPAGVFTPGREPAGPSSPIWVPAVRPALFALGIASITVGLCYDPVGARKAGRVVVDEFHSKWEPTGRPYDTSWYGHESGYNYACIYDYSSRFYDMSRLTAPIDDAALKDCDVFVLKCPTSRLAKDEVERLRKFVADGGGLLLVGEHTDVFGLGTNLNDVARPFGFQFRYDVLFNIDDEHPFDYRYDKPLVPHPIVQRMPTLDFEGPCTIEPTGWAGRAVMTAVGQHAEPATYHASNFMPPPEDRADSRYGAWVLMWSTKYGKGRVVAHADSTQWSNFSAFEPGKPESWVGMIEWLNHRNGAISDPRLELAALGLLLVIASVAGSRFMPGRWLVTIAAGACAFALTATAVRALHRSAMPVPERKADRPMINVGIDRTVSDAVLSKGGFIGGVTNGYGIFERWILRLGWFIQRGSGAELFENKDLVVFFQPAKDVTPEFREQLAQYVRGGGRVLVIDTPENTKSTANSLIKPLGLELNRPYTPITGNVTSSLGLPELPATMTYEVLGGDEVLATMSGRTVAATRRVGRGSVTAIGFGSRFSDPNMGVTGDVVPGEDLLKVYEVQYGLLRHLMGQPAVTRASTQPAAMTAPFKAQ